MNGAIQVEWFGPNTGCWTWVQDHFAHVHPVGTEELTAWSESPKAFSGSSPKVLIVALEHRSDDRLRAVTELMESPAWLDRPFPIACVLGTDWQGHRRTHPLPDRLEAFYWFQLADRILPWLLRNADRPEEGKRRPASRRNQVVESDQSRSNPRIQRLLEHASWSQQRIQALEELHLLAWVITDNQGQRDLWFDILERAHVRPVACRIDAAPLWCQPEMIVIDCVAREPDSVEKMQRRITALRNQYPEAFLTLVDPFPIWERWQTWIACGIDAVVPRPVQIEGLLLVWQRWLHERTPRRTPRAV